MSADFFSGLPIFWQGEDDSTPEGCTLVCTKVVGLPTTYILRAGEVIGRVEADGFRQLGYVGSGLQGGRYVGCGDFYGLAQRIVQRADKEE